MRRSVSLVLLAALAVLSGCMKKMETGEQRESAPASRLEIRLPEQGFVAGQAGQIEIRLIDDQGFPAPTPQAVTLELASGAGLGLPSSVEISAGGAGVDIAANPSAAGLFDVEVRAKNAPLEPAYATAATLEAPKPTLIPTTSVEKIAAPVGAPPLAGALVLKELSLDEIQARPEGRWAKILRTTGPIPHVAVETRDQEVEDHGSDTSSTPSPPPSPPPGIPQDQPPVAPPIATEAGQIVLKASPAEVVCGPGGWRPARIDAFWMVGKKPAKTPEAIAISLTSRGRGGSVDPNALTIPANGFQSAAPAAVQGEAAGRIEIEALAAGVEPAAPIGVDIVADPGRLDVQGDRTVRGLAVAHPSVTLQLVDPKRPDLALPVSRAIPVLLRVSGPVPTPLKTVTIDPATGTGSTTLDLERHGVYQITASSACIAPGSLKVTYALDWAMIAVAAGAGLLGSLLAHRPRRGTTTTLEKVARLALGAGVAALLAVLLASFGLLALLEKLLPEGGLWESLQKLPAASLTGTALTGFFAGFLSEKIWAALRKTKK